MKGGEKQCGKVDKLKPIIAIISLQFGYAGMYIITMVSFKHGMNHWVLATYRHVVATIVMAPFALILERYVCVIIAWSALEYFEPIRDYKYCHLTDMYVKTRSC